MNFRSLNTTGTVEGYVVVTKCEKKTSKKGDLFLDLVLADVSGEIVAKYWDFRQGESAELAVNDIIKVRGVLQQYNNQPQLKVDRYRFITEKDEVDLSQIIPSSEYDPNRLFDELYSIASSFADGDLRLLTVSVYDEYKDRLIEWPAAFRLHHAMRGGLLYHTLSMVSMAQAIMREYPSVDGDLLIAGTMLHDIAKTEELHLGKSGLVDKYTPEGNLLGHLVLGCMDVERIGTRVGVGRETLLLIEHMLISHHGEPEFGAAKRPLILEAEILNAIDNLDARVYEIEKALLDVAPGEMTAKQWALEDRQFYNHARKSISATAKLF